MNSNYDPLDRVSFRKCREFERQANAEGLSHSTRQELLLHAALLAADTAAATPEDLPKWRVRHWTDAVELAMLAGLPWVAALLAQRHLTQVVLPAERQRERLEEIVAAGRASRRVGRTARAAGDATWISEAAIQRLLLRHGIVEPQAPRREAA